MMSQPPEDGRPLGGAPPSGRGVYGIGVTSTMVGTAIQNIRAYERAGLLAPSRTVGGTRLYSADDVVRLQRIQALLAEGLNLAGIAQVMALQDDNQRLRDQLRVALEGSSDPASPGPAQS